MNDADGLIISELRNGGDHDSLMNGSLQFSSDTNESEAEEFDFEEKYPRKRRKPEVQNDNPDQVTADESASVSKLKTIWYVKTEHLKNEHVKNRLGLSEESEFEDSKEDELFTAHDEFGLGISRCCEAKRRLLRIHDMPDHLRFNKYVHTGYRNVQTAWECFMSLFYLHNETVNIVTHVIPIIGVLYYWRMMYPWDEIRDNIYFNILGWSHVMGSISPWLGSVIYHLFMNHRKGAKFYQFLLQIDMLGIWVTQCFGALTNLAASTWCLPQNIQTTWMVIYAIASVWGLHMALTAGTALGRRMCFAPVFVSRIFGFALRISPWGGGEPLILNHVVLQDVISVLGGMIGVVRIPEKWFPGKLDMFCNSHHIMHVLVVCAVLHMNWASNGDIRWILKNYSQSQSQCLCAF